MSLHCLLRRNTLFAAAALLLGAAALTGCGTQDSAHPPAITGAPSQGNGGSPSETSKPVVGLDVPQPASIVAGSNGLVLTATVTDGKGVPADGATLLFSSNIGSVGPVTALGSGKYEATFTGTLAGTARISVRARLSNVTSDPAATTVTVDAGAPAQISVTPSLDQIPPDGVTGSEIRVRVEDAFGNSASGTVDLTASSGEISPTQIDLVAGQGTANFTATTVGVAQVTASLEGSPEITASADVTVVASEEGVPAIVQVSAAPPQIFVAGVGQTEGTVIEVSVTDRFGTPIADVPDNVEVDLVSGPGGGENLGRDPTTGAPLAQATLSTSGGMASVTLNSGTVPGTVQVEAKVLRGADGALLAVPLTARVPEIVIVSGPPFSLTLARGANVADNQDGTLTRPYSVVVTDIYGNAVPDGTAVFFGQIANSKIPDSTIVEGTDGEIASAAPAIFSSAASDFSGVLEGDTLVLSSDPKGSYVVASVIDKNTLLLIVPVPVAADASGLEFTVVANKHGFDGAVASASPSRFESALSDFSNVSKGDTLIFLSGPKGGYVVDSVIDNNTLQLSTPVPVTKDVGGVKFVLGDNAGGGAFANITATSTGVAGASSTFPESLGQIWVYAETAGRAVGDAAWYAAP